MKSVSALGVLGLPGVPAWSSAAAAGPDLVLHLVAAPDRFRIWRGESTQVLRFTGEVMQGRADALHASGSYLGPTLELRRGERVRVHFDNQLNEPSIIHWHGLIVPDEADGHPRFAIAPGERFTYEFTVRNPAGTYFYHPHPHGDTGRQVYHGLTGLLIVRDEEEAAVGLPKGSFELPLVIQDRRVGAGNQLIFKNSMRDDMTGVLGDTLLVNGYPEARFEVMPASYRLRVVNASNARIYKLAWSDGLPLTVIGTDNGLLSVAQERPYVMLGPAERIEVLEDFGRRKPGAELTLTSQVFDDGTRMGMGNNTGMMGGMMDEMMGARGGSEAMNVQGREEMAIARFSIQAQRRRAPAVIQLPRASAGSRDAGREFRVRLGFRHMAGLLNGRRFAMEAVAAQERFTRDESTVWTFEHNPGMNMTMPHPMHIHGARFQILERRRGPGAPDVRDGLVDEGFKDTVLVFPGERVRLLVRPTEPGLFLYHCHNLEHEDGGMMRNYLVA